MDINNLYNTTDPSSYEQSLESHVSSVMRRVYQKMTLGLIVSALVAYFASTSAEVITFFAEHSTMMLVMFVVELGLVIGITSGLNKLSSGTATLLFYLFAAVNGLTLFPILLVYTSVSVYKTFFITAGVFGAMTIYGRYTTQDLSRWGTFLVMALIGLIVVSLVNIFLHSSTMDWIISGAGVLIFIGLTAWDTQNIKRMALMSPIDATEKVATVGALSLYLDFINLFLYLLRFFNDRD